MKSYTVFLIIGMSLITSSPAALGQSDAVQGLGRDQDRESSYSRSMSSVLERAQADLEKTIEIWEEHSAWEDPWDVQTGPFLVRTTHSRGLALEIGRNLEVMLAEFEDVLKPDFRTRDLLRIYIFPGVPLYNQFGEEFGEHHSSIYGSFFAAGSPERPVAAIYDDNLTLLRMYVTHSALHQFVDRAFSRRPPTWLSEGLASYFALRWAYAWGVSELEKLKENGRFIPLSRLLNASIDQYGDATHERFIELGMFVYYLLHFREDTWMTDDENGAFVDYVRAILSGGDTSQLPFQEAITRRRNELESDFRSFSFPE